MAGRQDRLVKAIRAKRRTLMRAVEQSAGPLDPLRDSVRRHPTAWAFGSVLVGVVVVRSFGSTFLRGGRRLAGTWVRGRVGAALVGAAMKAYEAVKFEFEPPPRPSHHASGTASKARSTSDTGVRSDGAASASGRSEARAAVPRADSEQGASRPRSGPAASLEPQDPQAFSRS